MPPPPRSLAFSAFNLFLLASASMATIIFINANARALSGETGMAAGKDYQAKVGVEKSRHTRSLSGGEGEGEGDGDGDVQEAMKIGSRPKPLCTGKCRGCAPCSPVEITVPPSQLGYEHNSFHVDDQQTPYYSIAWRCRCKGKDYNP